MNVDTLLKYLADRYPDHLAAWLLGQPRDRLGAVEVMKSELNAEQIRADFVALVRSAGTILHVEFQYSSPAASATPIGLRMLDYAVRLHRQHRLPVEQVLVLISPTGTPTPGLYRIGRTRHAFRVVRMWEEDPAPLLADEALLPLATLARASDRRELLSAVAAGVRRIESSARRSEIGALAQLLAGLASPWEVIQAMFGEDILEESTVYQEILRRGEARGKAEGLRQGAELLLLDVLASRFGPVTADIRATLERCPVEVLQHLAPVAATCTSIDDFGRAAEALAPA